MNQPLVIVHGWSDHANSFFDLARRLANTLNRPLQAINLADWVSLNDDVTYTDLAVAMQAAWEKLPHHAQPRHYDVIVHSTGALVIREWMTRFYQPETVPIKRFVQLAPANFGSPLAHKGRSILGRIFKGGIANRFQTGTHLLKGLELASPYLWQLAEKDLFSEEPGDAPAKRWYGKDRILASVFVGMKTYDGIPGAFAGHGCDGTVRVATANLKATHISMDMRDLSVTISPSPTDIVMLPVDRFDHTSIVQSKSPRILSLLIDALTVEDDGWLTMCRSRDLEHDEIISKQHAARDSHRHAFQNTVVRVCDEYGQWLPDYLLEVKLHDQDQGFFSRFFQTSAIDDVHVNKSHSSYRALFIDVTEWKKRIDQAHDQVDITIAASPEYQQLSPTERMRPEDKRQYQVGFEPKSIQVPYDQLDAYFAPNRTVLIDVILPRQIDAGLVRIDPYDDVARSYSS